MHAKNPSTQTAWFRRDNSEALMRGVCFFRHRISPATVLVVMELSVLSGCWKAPVDRSENMPQTSATPIPYLQHADGIAIAAGETENPFPPALRARPWKDLRAFSKTQFQVQPGAWRNWLLGIAESAEDSEAELAIRLLAEGGDPEAFPKLAMIARDDAWPDGLRREAAAGLVRYGGPQDAKIGLRALGVLGSEEDARLLVGHLKQSVLPLGLREVAAYALADTQDSAAADALFALLADSDQWQDRDTAEAFQKTLVNAAGRLPFQSTETHFRTLMESASVPDAVRAAAAEALGGNSPDAVPFLMKVASGDSHPEVREMAAWALSNHGAFEGGGGALGDMARKEPEAAVRTRLYEAMLEQEDNPSAKLLQQMTLEEDDQARIAAWNALGDAVSKSADPSLARHFDTEVVPRLLDEASSARSLNLRMRSVFALRRAQTAESLRALESLSNSSTPEIARAAANGLPAPIVKAPDHSTNPNTNYEN